MTDATLQGSRQSERERRMECGTGKVALISQELGIHILTLYNGRKVLEVAGGDCLVSIRLISAQPD